MKVYPGVLTVTWLVGFCLCNSSTMTCPPVCGDNPRILASGYFYVQVTNIVQLRVFHTTYISVGLAHPGAFHAKVVCVQCVSSCPVNKCLPDSYICPYPLFFSHPRTGVCRGCNYCVKPGTPKDSIGCPMLPCTPFPIGDCKTL